MAFNFFTSFFSALSNPSAYSSFQKEMNLKAVEQVFFNSLSGKTSFMAVVLTNTGDIGTKSDNFKSIRVRPIDIHDFIIPEPCSFKDPKHRKKIIALHPVAYPDSSWKFAGGNDQEADALSFGNIVECFFDDGPQGGGRLRGLNYRPKIISRTSNLNVECLQEFQAAGGTRAAFDEGSAVPMDDFVGPLSSGVLDNLRQTEAEYVKNSTLQNIETFETSDGVKHVPLKKTYHGILEQFKGKEFRNGLLPLEMIAQSTSAQGYPALFLKDVIYDFDRLAQAFEIRFGSKLYIVGKTIDKKNIPSGTYRTFDQQIRIKNQKIAEKKSGEAAQPGTSNHGWGLAFDFGTQDSKGRKGFQSETYKWMLENAPSYGFENPSVLRDGVGYDEAWHIQWIKINDIWR